MMMLPTILLLQACAAIKLKLRDSNESGEKGVDDRPVIVLDAHPLPLIAPSEDPALNNASLAEVVGTASSQAMLQAQAEWATREAVKESEGLRKLAEMRKMKKMRQSALSDKQALLSNKERSEAEEGEAHHAKRAHRGTRRGSRGALIEESAEGKGHRNKAGKKHHKDFAGAARRKQLAAAEKSFKQAALLNVGQVAKGEAHHAKQH